MGCCIHPPLHVGGPVLLLLSLVAVGLLSVYAAQRGLVLQPAIILSFGYDALLYSDS